VARKAVNYMKSTGVADAAVFGPSLEFFVFDDVKFDQTPHSAFYYVDTNEGQWNTGRDERPNLAYKIPYKQGYFPCGPSDSLHDLRSEMMLAMMQCGLTVESHHHEKAGGGQCAINVRYDELVPMADNVLKYKYVVKNTARRHNKAATFMPKPLFEDYGSGMHVHVSLWKKKNGESVNLFYGNDYSNLSDVAMYALGGLLKHAPALCAITNPTTNSYKRLVPGYEAPVNLAYSQRNRSGAHPGVLVAAEVEAVGVPHPGRHREPVPRLRRHADGDAGRHPQQDAPRRAVGQRHLRHGPGATEGRTEDASNAGRSADGAGEGPRVFAARRGVHGRRDRNVDRLQAEGGSGGDPRAPAPLRVRPVLRQLSITLGLRRTFRRHRSPQRSCRGCP
jgi:Glutamine synthetase, catalytic domain